MTLDSETAFAILIHLRNHLANSPDTVLAALAAKLADAIQVEKLDDDEREKWADREAKRLENSPPINLGALNAAGEEAPFLPSKAKAKTKRAAVNGGADGHHINTTEDF